jgi:hypothetical protein
MKNGVNRAAKAKTTDKDLRFLSSCENEDLRVLCDILTHDRRYYEMKNASFFARVQQACREMFYSHPQNCQRAYEIDRWKSSANYHTLKSSANYRTLTKDLTITNLTCKRVSPTQD